MGDLRQSRMLIDWGQMQIMIRDTFVWTAITLVLLIVSLAIYSIPQAFAVRWSFLGIVAIVVPIITHICLIVYFYKSGKYSLFALPASQVSLSVMLFIVALSIVAVLSVPMSTAWYWFAGITAITVFYFLPVTFITSIISLIMRFRS